MKPAANQKPEILHREIIGKTRLFTVEAVHLRFSNGARATFERLNSGAGIVMVIAINDADAMVMVNEYAVGTDSYELGFVKGRIDPGETPAHAALRELSEEIGFGAHKLTELRSVHSAPGYTTSTTHIFIAEQLYPHQLPGDEIEPLEQVEWPLAKLSELLTHPRVNDARVLLALLLLDARST